MRLRTKKGQRLRDRRRRCRAERNAQKQQRRLERQERISGERVAAALVREEAWCADFLKRGVLPSDKLRLVSGRNYTARNQFQWVDPNAMGEAIGAAFRDSADSLIYATLKAQAEITQSIAWIKRKNRSGGTP